MDSSRPIPGPDHGACPDCGGWIRAGLIHDCDAERSQQDEDAKQLMAVLERCGDCGEPLATHGWTLPGDPDGPMPVCVDRSSPEQVLESWKFACTGWMERALAAETVVEQQTAEVAALRDAVEAASRCVILEYSPTYTVTGNEMAAARASEWREALGKVRLFFSLQAKITNQKET